MAPSVRVWAYVGKATRHYPKPYKLSFTVVGEPAFPAAPTYRGRDSPGSGPAMRQTAGGLAFVVLASAVVASRAPRRLFETHPAQSMSAPLGRPLCFRDYSYRFAHALTRPQSAPDLIRRGSLVVSCHAGSSRFASVDVASVSLDS